MPIQENEPPNEPAFQLNELLGYRMARLSASIGMLAEREARATAGLTLPEYRLLAVLSSHGPHGVSGLQKLLHIDKAWISRNLAKLVAKKLVTARHHENDGRRTVYAPTKAGDEAARELIRKALNRQLRLMTGFKDEDGAMLMELLNRLQQNVDIEIERR